MKILVLADQKSKTLYDYYEPDKLKGVELVISCGDLEPGYLDFSQLCAMPQYCMSEEIMMILINITPRKDVFALKMISMSMKEYELWDLEGLWNIFQEQRTSIRNE